jgi:hypothetical protein
MSRFIQHRRAKCQLGTPQWSPFDRALIRIAVKSGSTRAAQKHNLTLLYETGAINGAVLQGAIFQHELGDA